MYLSLKHNTSSKLQQAFIKWAQWASTRPDIFPEDLCSVLASLQSGAPEHSFSFTNRQIQKELGAPINQIFESFSRTPIASGSIAQVYKVSNPSSNISLLHICAELLCYKYCYAIFCPLGKTEWPRCCYKSSPPECRRADRDGFYNNEMACVYS